MTELPPSPLSARSQATRFVASVHLLRTLGLALGACMVAAVLYRDGASDAVWGLLVLNGFAWPHIARMLAQREADPVRAERRNILVDSLMGGVWIALIRFNLLPSAVLLTMLAMDCIVIGGGRLLLRGVFLQSLACALMFAANGFAFAPATGMFELIASLPFLMAYPLAVSAVTYRLTRRVHKQNHLLARLSSIDGLSELLNRAHWEHAVDGVLDHWRGNGRPASLLMIDIDHFKEINDRYGHTVGDEVIGRVGAIIRRSLRDGDIAGRYGGDEFGVLLNGINPWVAAQVAERIRASVHAATFEHAGDLRCTLSIGIAQADNEVRDARDWIRLADAALYNAKLCGRNRLATSTWELNSEPA